MLVYIWLYTQNTKKMLILDSNIAIFNWESKRLGQNSKELNLYKFRDCWENPFEIPLPSPQWLLTARQQKVLAAPSNSLPPPRPTEGHRNRQEGLWGKKQIFQTYSPDVLCWVRKGRPGSSGFTNTEHPVSLTPVPGFPQIIINIQNVSWMKMSHHHPLFVQSHIPNSAFHSSLPRQGTARGTEHGIKGV